MLRAFLDGLRGLALSGVLPNAERRAMPRLRCYYPVSCKTTSNEIRSARVTEMSRAGMRMEITYAFKKGTPLNITYASPHPADTVECRVVWTRKRPSGNYWMGVAYSESPEVLDKSWVGYVLHELGFEDSDVFTQRKNIRYPANLQAELQTAKGDLVSPAVVINLGVGGALVEIPRSLAPNPEVVLSLAPQPGVAGGKLVILSDLLIVRPNPDRGSGFLGHLKFLSMNRAQTRHLGRHLIALLRAASN